MGLKKLAAKVAEYNDRLDSGKASKIKPDHVRRVLQKLRKKELSLTEELAGARDEEAKARLERKLEVAREHVARAEWLLGEID